ncbi:hypothetical protein RFI_06372 [Reticulomyxa filosa]|uniref:Uncharacterized protein n=1 Tax=Reticulomyxa filosa TaxID=46433 RepID=X6NZM2_RETFI|nr:hypothetical protein RFI_06372 [Reticulomyxa filosa]|eukprot:ETO30747.1 hypothetical protein RFI_06372 [Reticulomyxa filosa]
MCDYDVFPKYESITKRRIRNSNGKNNQETIEKQFEEEKIRLENLRQRRQQLAKHRYNIFHGTRADKKEFLLVKKNEIVCIHRKFSTCFFLYYASAQKNEEFKEHLKIKRDLKTQALKEEENLHEKIVQFRDNVEKKTEIENIARRQYYQQLLAENKQVKVSHKPVNKIKKILYNSCKNIVKKFERKEGKRKFKKIRAKTRNFNNAGHQIYFKRKRFIVMSSIQFCCLDNKV